MEIICKILKTSVIQIGIKIVFCLILDCTQVNLILLYTNFSSYKQSYIKYVISQKWLSLEMFSLTFTS